MRGPAARSPSSSVEPGHERASRATSGTFLRHDRQRWYRRLAPEPARPATPDASGALEGGYLCGAIRYRIAARANDVAHCHCGLCRRSTGAPFVTWLTVAASFTS
jgi:hypothetical protein